MKLVKIVLEFPFYNVFRRVNNITFAVDLWGYQLDHLSYSLKYHSNDLAVYKFSKAPAKKIRFVTNKIYLEDIKVITIKSSSRNDCGYDNVIKISM